MNANSNRLLIASCSILIALSGCAADNGRYPSLAIRDYERTSGQFTPAPVEITPTQPVVTSGELSEILAQARSSHESFLASAPRVDSLVIRAGGLSPESNDWAVAQVALADLIAQRGVTATALSNIDSLEVEAATTFAPTEDIRSAAMEVDALVAEEDSILEALKLQLGL